MSATIVTFATAPADARCFCCGDGIDPKDAGDFLVQVGERLICEACTYNHIEFGAVAARAARAILDRGWGDAELRNDLDRLREAVAPGARAALTTMDIVVTSFATGQPVPSEVIKKGSASLRAAVAAMTPALLVCCSLAVAIGAIWTAVFA